MIALAVLLSVTAPTPRAAALIATIIKVDDSTATMPKATRDALLRDVSWSAELRVVKVETGYRLFGIRPDSLCDRINLQNGDTLTHLNGIALLDDAAVAKARSEAKTATTMTLRLRRGEAGRELLVLVR